MKIEITIIMILAIIITLLTIWLGYTLFSKRKKAIVEKYLQEAKQERKAILRNGYQEINDLKASFELEKRAQISQHQFELEMIAKQQKAIVDQTSFLEMQEQKFTNKLTELQKLESEYELKLKDILFKLEQVSNFSQIQAKEELFEIVAQKHKKELNAFIKNNENEAFKSAKNRATDIIVQAMEKFKTDIVNEKTTNTIKLPNEETKGRIIGKEGRNIKAFEQYAGVEIIIDETPNIITISSFNPIRREIATKALEKLIIDGRIHPNKIETELLFAQEKLEETILEEGYKTIDELNIQNIDVELVKLIGKLKYRTSYGQNALLHSVEVAKLSSSIASELGLNAQSAMRAGLLHDIGKAVDFEQEGSHVMLGVEIATKYHESEIIINSIAAHHQEVPKESEIAAIVAIADSLSASRPGARNNSLNDFMKRMNEIETKCNAIPGVSKSYALQSGRQIRIIVNPMLINDLELLDIIEKVKNEILTNIVVPGDITITVIRETREVKIFK